MIQPAIAIVFIESLGPESLGPEGRSTMCGVTLPRERVLSSDNRFNTLSDPDWSCSGLRIEDVGFRDMTAYDPVLTVAGTACSGAAREIFAITSSRNPNRSTTPSLRIRSLSTTPSVLGR